MVYAGLSNKLTEADMQKPLRRSPVNKARSARQFRNKTRRTKAANAPLRGGYRF